MGFAVILDGCQKNITILLTFLLAHALHFEETIDKRRSPPGHIPQCCIAKHYVSRNLLPACKRGT